MSTREQLFARADKNFKLDYLAPWDAEALDHFHHGINSHWHPLSHCGFLLLSFLCCPRVDTFCLYYSISSSGTNGSMSELLRIKCASKGRRKANNDRQ